MGVLKQAIFRNFAVFRLPASAASDVGLTLKTRLNTLKQPTLDYPSNQLAGKREKLADPKGKKIWLTQKGKIFGRKKREKFRPISWSEKREKFSGQKGKNFEKGKNFDEKGKMT